MSRSLAELTNIWFYRYNEVTDITEVVVYEHFEQNKHRIEECKSVYYICFYIYTYICIRMYVCMRMHVCLVHTHMMRSIISKQLTLKLVIDRSDGTTARNVYNIR